jgi:SHS2 domain-containing protein
MSASSRTVEHVGEWRVEVEADSLEEIVRELARVIGRAAGPVSDGPGAWEDLVVEAHDAESTLVACANELVGRGEIEQRAYDELRNIAVDSGTPFRLQAEVRGRPVRSWRSPLKAATYHGAALTRAGSRWRVSILFDV